MTSEADQKTQKGIVNANQENIIPPMRLTRLQKAKLEALNAFGNCALDSMVFKKVDFHVKLKGATPQCDGTLKRKNPECNDPRNVVQTKRPATEKRHQAKAAVKTNAPLKVTKSSGNVSLTSGEASRTKTVQRPHSSLVSFRRMTRIERARLEALESFGNQGLDAVWDSCSKIRSKTLDKKENEDKKEKEEGDDAVQITEGGTNDEEANREEGQVEVVKSCDARGENYTDKKSSYQPAKEEVDSEEAESIGPKGCRGTEQGKTGAGQGKSQELCKKLHPSQVDLFSSIQDTSFVDREALLSTSKKVLEMARSLETPSPQESPVALS